VHPKIEMTALKLYRTCTESRIKATRDLALRKAFRGENKKVRVVPKGSPYFRFVIFSKKQKHDHRVTIFVPNDDEFSAKARVITDCDCFDAMFRYEYVMAQKYGTSFMYRCNGEPPIETNPGMRPGICKHVRFALQHLLKRAKSGSLNKMKKV